MKIEEIRVGECVRVFLCEHFSCCFYDYEL